MIFLKTDIINLPENCAKCTCFNCSLPLKKDSLRFTIKEINTRYYSKRHGSCPLVEINNTTDAFNVLRKG